MCLAKTKYIFGYRHQSLSFVFPLVGLDKGWFFISDQQEQTDSTTCFTMFLHNEPKDIIPTLQVSDTSKDQYQALISGIKGSSITIPPRFQYKGTGVT